jgi:hypothetical protein
MDRRKAILIISAAAAGTLIIPSCTSKMPGTKAFSRLNIEQNQIKILEKLSEKILPIPSEYILENVSPNDFLLTMLEDCATPEQISKFEEGMSQFQLFLKEENKTIQDLSVKELETLTSETEENNVQFFINTVKQLNVQYYTSTKDYLNNYTDWEFVPGRFNGCVSV